MRKIIVSDITLKQKEHNFTFRDKAEIARCLDKLGVDAIELPEITNLKEDTIINKTISDSVKSSSVKISAGLTFESLEAAWNSIKDAKSPGLQISIPTSPVQMEYICHIKPPKVLELIAAMCSAAKEKCSNIEFVAADATRAEKEFLTAACTTAKENGAVCITLCDDAGILMPETCAGFIGEITEACHLPVYIQTSDTMYMAAACAMSAVKAGAAGVKTSLTDKNMLSTEKFAQIIRLAGADNGLECGINIAEIHHGASALISMINGGKAHIVTSAPDMRVSVDLGRSSSMSDVCSAVRALGYELEDEDNARVYEAFTRVANKKGQVGAKELDAIIASTALQVPSTYHIESYVINSGNIITATANIVLSKEGRKFSGISAGDGPIDAAFLAIEQIIGHHYELDDFQIQAVTEGREAMGSALVKLRSQGRLYSGNGISTDIVGASIRAYINALNKIIYEEN